jgi:hypothetical protein
MQEPGGRFIEQKLLLSSSLGVAKIIFVTDMISVTLRCPTNPPHVYKLMDHNTAGNTN